jgi:hypothetical protein
MQVILEVSALPSVLPATANGNNVVVMCSCGKPFLLSSHANYNNGARCPHCHDTVAHLKAAVGRGKKIEKQDDVVFQLAGQQWPIDAKPQTETAKKRTKVALKVAA